MIYTWFISVYKTSTSDWLTSWSTHFALPGGPPWILVTPVPPLRVVRPEMQGERDFSLCSIYQSKRPIFGPFHHIFKTTWCSREVENSHAKPFLDDFCVPLVPFLRNSSVFWDNCVFASMTYWFRLTNVCFLGLPNLGYLCFAVAKPRRLMSIAWSWYSIHEIKWRCEELSARRL